jgi:heme A synthase
VQHPQLWQYQLQPVCHVCCPQLQHHDRVMVARPVCDCICVHAVLVAAQHALPAAVGRRDAVVVCRKLLPAGGGGGGQGHQDTVKLSDGVQCINAVLVATQHALPAAVRGHDAVIICRKLLPVKRQDDRLQQDSTEQLLDGTGTAHHSTPCQQQEERCTALISTYSAKSMPCSG